MGVDVGTATGYLDLDISGFLAGLRSAQSEAQKTTQNMATQIGNGFKGVGQSLMSAGSTLTKSVTIPIVGLGTAIVKTSADFESSMSKVKAISGATGNEFDALQSKAREMGAKTKFSASESAEAFQYMAMAGWDVNSMLGGISGVMNLAAASGEELGTVSDIVTDAMTAFGLSAKDTSKVLKDGIEVEVDNTTRFVDALAAASNSSNTNVAMLGESFKYVAPVAGALGYSVEDTAIALGFMANQGIKASSAGTALRTMLTNMANPTDTMASAMDTLGVSLENSDGSMKSLMEVMQDLRKGFGQGHMDADEFTKSMSELQASFDEGKISEDDYAASVENLMAAMYGAEGAQKAQLAAQLAGKTGMAGLLAIVNTGEEDFNNLADSIYNAAGTSQEMADIMNDNLSGQITIMLSALQELALQFGEILLPHIKNFVAWLQELIAKLQQMSPEQKEQVVRWAAIAAAIGPVLLVFGKLTTGIGSILTTFGKIPGMITKLKSGFTLLKGAIAGVNAPIVAIVAVIAILAAAFKHLWETNEEFRAKITAIWDGLKSKFEEFGQGIVDRLNALGFDFENITEVLSAIWNGFCELLAPVFEGVFSQLSNILSAALDILTGIFDVFIGIFTGNWEQAWNGVKEIFGAVWDCIKNTFQNWVNAFKGIADVILGWFGTSWEEAWNSVVNFFKDTWTSIKNFFTDTWNSILTFFTNIIDTIKNAVSGFVQSIADFFSNMVTNIKNFISDAWNAVVQWAKNMVDKASEMGKNFLDNIVSFFTQLPGKILGFITSALDNVKQWATDMVNKAREMAKSFLEKVVEFFTDLPYKIGYFIGSALANVVKWVTDMVNKAKEMGENFINAVVSFFTQLPGKIKQFIDSAFDNVKTWATNMANKAKEAVTNFLNNVKNTLTSLPSTIKGYLDSAISNVTSWVTSMGSKAKSAASDFLNNVKNGITSLPSTIKTQLNNSLSKVTSWGSDLASKGRQAVSNLVNGVKSAASNIASQVESIGKNIVDGVWQGIQKAKNSFVNSVKNFFSGIVNGVKDILGIKSPSRVFAKEVGRWLPPGVAQGFKAALPASMKQIENDLNRSIDELDADDISIDVFANNKRNFLDKTRDAFEQVATLFESAEVRMIQALDNMSEKFKELINVGQFVLSADADKALGYVGYDGFGVSQNRFIQKDNKPHENTNNDDVSKRTYVFYSPVPIDEIEAAKQLKKTERDIAEGFL